jgi:hypothetical protein
MGGNVGGTTNPPLWKGGIDNRMFLLIESSDERTWCQKSELSLPAGIDPRHSQRVVPAVGA